MDIFISWHGKRSHAAAEALRGWLPLIVNAFKPWLSSADINKGVRWRSELAAKLGSATAGIFCLTPSNLTAPWLIFEAGAISRTPETYVCTLLIGLQSSDVTDPLAQFQATKDTKEDMHQLVKNLNKALGTDAMEEAHVNRAFEKWWPDLEKELKNLPPDEAAPAPQRKEREMLQEVLEKVRDLSQTLRSQSTYFAQVEGAREVLAGAPMTAAQADALRAWRNAGAHRVAGPQEIQRAVDVALKSAGVENALEFNRALQELANVTIGMAGKAAKGNVAGGDSKPTEAPKQPAPAKQADPSDSRKTKP
jgi:hypothetical protein